MGESRQEYELLTSKLMVGNCVIYSVSCIKFVSFTYYDTWLPTVCALCLSSLYVCALTLDPKLE